MDIKMPALPMFQKKAEPNFGQQIAAMPAVTEAKPAALNETQGTKLDIQKA